MHGHLFSVIFYQGRGRMGANSVKYGNKSLKDKNDSNASILTGFFLNLKYDFPFLEAQNGGSGSHLTTSLPGDASKSARC